MYVIQLNSLSCKKNINFKIVYVIYYFRKEKYLKK